MLTTATIVPELLDRLHIAQDHYTTLQKYWLPAHSTHADHSTVHNSIGKVLSIKGYLYIPKSLVPTIPFEYHDVRGHFG